MREAGYLRLKGWLDPADMARIVADMDRALPHYCEGDGKSWWATLKDGARCCVRMQGFVEHSPTTARILSGEAWERLRRIVAGQDELAQVPVEGRIIEALYKPVGVVSGPSDVSFHRDCHLGRHAYVCSRMTVGVALTPTGDGNGGLRVVAGSHRVAMPVETAKTRPYLPVVALPTEAGDLTVHLSCTLHEATPPAFAERRVMYTELPLAPHAGAVGPIDTSVGHIRERVSDIARESQAADAAARPAAE
ncbi:phytanoyl-CoA dioxygenase family protein [Phenylobacterium sp. LjRoot225]